VVASLIPVGRRFFPSVQTDPASRIAMIWFLSIFPLRFFLILFSPQSLISLSLGPGRHSRAEDMESVK